MINLIYLVPSEKGPAGGINVILQHSEIINKLKKNFTSKVIFIKKKKTSKWKNSFDKLININHEKSHSGWKFKQISIDKFYKGKWFNNNVVLKNNFNFDKKKDFVILPEIFAHFAKDLLIKNNINYAIFVQNGLALNITDEYHLLDLAYSKAKFILSVSSHINESIKMAFPKTKKKIFKINQAITTNNFSYKSKLKLITYMPRKLPHHSKLVLFFLRNNLPKDWRVLPLEKMNQTEVFKNLKKSKIFLSFSNLEGFGLPPLEAAISGNVVIGYTGEGGKEYWKTPIFKKIEQGDILGFVNKINSTIKNRFNYNSLNIHKRKLLKKYSHINQKKKIFEMLKMIYKNFN
jgi:hypothetical protein